MSLEIMSEAKNESHELIRTLKLKIKDKSALVGVVGLGYVGLPFAVEKAKVGFHVLGFEQNPVRATKVNLAENYITDVDDEELKDFVAKGLIRAETSFENISKMDVIVVCVPTPLDRYLAPDLQHVINVTKEVASRLRPGQLISLESTTYPGTTEEIMLPILEETSKLRVEKDFFLCHSPERVDPGNKRYTTKNTNKVIGGVGPLSLEIGKEFYSATIENMVQVSNTRAAEMTKVFENTFRAVNIALVNELALLCDKMNLNVWEILDAAFTKPFGIMPFYPGPGVGGHCIPIDPHYLEWKAKEYNFTTKFIGLAGEVNRRMPEFVREKVLRVLNTMGLAPSNSKVLMMGMSYKKDLGDYRDSPAIHITRLLMLDGVEIFYHDSFVPVIDVDSKVFNSIPLTEESVKNADLVLIVTDHTTVDYKWLVDNAKSILDTRNATKGIEDTHQKVVLL